MRVIAGTARGIRLEAPRGRHTRPTLDRVREALFSILGGHVEEARFLDLFAGTGANGIEALSRSAAWATFVDNDSKALAVVARNLETAKVLDRADMRPLALPRGIEALARSAAPYHIVFADPPYEFADYAALLEQLQLHHVLEKESIVIVEHATRTPLPQQAGALACYRDARYGDTTLSFFS